MRRRKPLVEESWKRVVQGFAWISLAAVLLNLIGAWRAEEREPRSLTRSVGSREDDAVRINAHLGADRLEPGTKVDCWLLVHNTSGKAITNVRVIGWDAPGLTRPKFDPATAGSLDSGRGIFFRPYSPIVALTKPARFLVTAEVEWTMDGKVRRQPVSLGSVLIQDATEPRVFAVTRTYVGLLRDLAMPIGLLLITWLLQKIGAYYLPTRQAEDIVVDAQDLSVALLKPWIDPLALASAKDQLTAYTEYYIFREKALGHADVQKVRAGLINWLTTDPAGMKQAFAILPIMEEVLIHDINLIYEFWYEDKPQERPDGGPFHCPPI